MSYQMDNNNLELIVQMLNDLRVEQKEVNKCLSRLESRLVITETKRDEQERINSKVNDLYEWRIRFLAIQAFLSFVIPIAISTTALLFQR